MQIGSVDFKVETLSAILRECLGFFTKDELEFVVAYTTDQMGLLYNPVALQLQFTPERRAQLVALATDQRISSYVFRLGTLVSGRHPDAKWEIVYVPGLDLLKFVYLG